MAPPPVEPAALPLHPLLAARRSPLAFDPSAEVVSQELAALLEAARWAPSSRNTQPWRFVVGRRDDDTHKRVLGTLPTGEQRWVGRAPLLLVAAHLTRSEAGGELRHGAYDLGQAVAHLTVQATALGCTCTSSPTSTPGRCTRSWTCRRARHHVGTLLLG